MVRTIIHGARMGGGCPNGVQHTGIKFPSYWGGGGKVDRGCFLPPRCEFFLVRTLIMIIIQIKLFFKRKKSMLPDPTIQTYLLSPQGLCHLSDGGLAVPHAPGDFSDLFSTFYEMASAK